MLLRVRWSSLGLALSLLAATGGVCRGQNASSKPLSQALSSPKQNAAARNAQWFLRGRASAGQPAATLLLHAYQQKLQARAALQAAVQRAASAIPHASASSGWISLGPAPLASDASGSGVQDYNWVSGRATAVAVDRADGSGNTVYVGGAYGGVWKSTNAGPLSSSPANVVWTPLIDNQATLSVGAIAIQPQPTIPDATKSVILVGTGETNSSTDSYYGLGILRSADAGKTWSLIKQDSTGKHSFAGIGFSQIAFSTANPSLVVAAAAGTSQGEIAGLANPQSANLGLYYSTDGGVTWIASIVRDGASAVPAVSATSVVYNGAAGEFFAALRFHGFYASPDGVTWTRLTNQPGNGLITTSCPVSPAQATCPMYRGELAAVPGRNEIYAWYVDSSNADQGIWRSTNAGSSWSQLDETGIQNCGDLIGGCGPEDGSYNLTLAAVPDGSTGTDVYAGAVNIFRCEISQLLPSCSANATPTPPPQFTFLNLTHVYGCPPDLGSIAKVHPNQHAIDGMVINSGGQVVMYFANDGGIYRGLDGYTGLISGTCGTPNQFDSLNQTLGSMTQFVSLAQPPTDPSTLLGGTQGNGSPATASTISGAWQEVNSADGGYSEINPKNPDEWFTANTGVSIQRCEFGVDCHAQDFNADLIVSNSTVGGDVGPLYMPFLLDPQNSGELIVGTCRVWRGTTDGTGFSVDSVNFETGSTDACTGDEVNMVRSIAAGGPTDSNGFSSVIYAGTDGLGPFAATTNNGGHIWVTTNASGGAATWVDRTGAINPNNFPISGVAIDRSDPSGNTAYVTIMGFHTSHVWQTTNAGRTWTDFTGSGLPDAPANAVVVDPGTTPTTGMVYVATDVGVFSSRTGTAQWSEVGPTPASGQAGYLPNVAVTALRLFNGGSNKLLRAATYGRGVWQFPLSTTPDFQISLPNSSQTILATETATFNGLIGEFNGYSNPVTLSCAAGSTAPPSQCAIAPNPATPSAQGTPFVLTAGGTVSDYSFLVTATGGGTNPIIHSTAVTLHIVDFTVSPPSPASLTLLSGQTSSPVTLQVGFLGSFPASGTVDFSCTAPANVTCNFFPSASVIASQGNMQTVTLKLTAASSAQNGSYSVNVSATSSAGDPETISHTLGLNIDNSGYTLAIQSPSALAAGHDGMVSGNADAVFGYSSLVQLSCAADGNGDPTPSDCSITPSSVVPSSNGTAFQVTLGNSGAGSFSFALRGKGSDGLEVDTPLQLMVYDFTISGSTSPPVPAGQTASYMLTFTPLPSGTTFQNAVGSFSCSNLPALTTCSFGTTQIASGSGATTVTLKISTTAPVASLREPLRDRRPSFIYAALWPLGVWFGLVGIKKRSRRRRWSRAWVLGVVFLLLMAALPSGCGGGLTGGGPPPPAPQPGTTPGTYPVTINATEGPLTRSASVTLTVQ